MKTHRHSIASATRFAALVACTLIAPIVGASAQRSSFKLTDLDPLTSLPWTEPGATLDAVLGAIYREPDFMIRSAVLAGYLRAMPVEQLGLAFDACIALEAAMRKSLTWLLENPWGGGTRKRKLEQPGH